MIGGAEHYCHKRLLIFIQAFKVLIGPVHQISITNAPGPDKLRIDKLGLVNNFVKTVAQKPASHIIKPALAAIHKH